MLYDSACKTAAQVVNILKVEHTLPLRDGVCSTNAQIRDGGPVKIYAQIYLQAPAE